MRFVATLESIVCNHLLCDQNLSFGTSDCKMKVCEFDVNVQRYLRCDTDTLIFTQFFLFAGRQNIIHGSCDQRKETHGVQGWKRSRTYQKFQKKKISLFVHLFSRLH